MTLRPLSYPMGQCDQCDAEWEGTLDICPECGASQLIDTQVLCGNCKQTFNGLFKTCPYCGSTNILAVPATSAE